MPVRGKRVVLEDIYYGAQGVDTHQKEILYETAWAQFEALLPKLEPCNIDSLPVNVRCAAKEHYWQKVHLYVSLNGDGKVTRPSTGCVEELLTGAHVGVGEAFGGTWELQIKILRTFKPNPSGGALCPFKDLAR